MKDWISVKDRLPERGVRVLACEEGNDWIWVSFMNPYGSLWGDGACTATHWIPLPQVPNLI